MRKIRLSDVHVYEARSNFWVGEIIKKISGGESLYLDYSTPWGFTLRYTEDLKPHSIEFDNGKVWTFCCPGDKGWPELLRSAASLKARAYRIYTDSMHLSLSSDKACLGDLLIWHHPQYKCV
jgi:hypothetical protein